MNTYQPTASYFRVATATPEVFLGNVKRNATEITRLYAAAASECASLVVFPELCLTGYSIGDLLQSPQLLDDAVNALGTLAHQTVNGPAMIVGLPLKLDNALYNCAALLADGEIKGIVPKINLPSYKEFYEKRWFQSWQSGTIDIEINSRPVPFGQMLFDIADARIGIEICEDLWVADQPAITLVKNGAEIICNPSASPEIVTKADYRRQLVASTSARLICGYVYAGADPSESTMDVVMGGHALISSMGRTLAERTAFTDPQKPRLLVADIDIDHIRSDRIHDNNFPNMHDITVVKTHVVRTQVNLLQPIDASPFIPKGSDIDVVKRLDEILTIQSFGLKKRLDASGVKKVVLGLSGGLDSTLSLLVALRTAKLRGITANDMILTLTMPGEASSGRTQTNAQKLAKSLGVDNRMIPIDELVTSQLSAMGRQPHLQDITYENTQARLRTALLFNTANSERALVLGTGDLSEVALGWCTFNGDHMSAYNVNGSIPKSLVKYLVRYEAGLVGGVAKKLLLDILDTPISPELVSTNKGIISQKTEDLVGPYELHDFFLYRFIRYRESPEKILWLAEHAFKETYKPSEIQKWLKMFLTRFAANQWKRSVMPDGPKVGSVSLSPRGDWRMPSDVDPGVF